MGFSDSLVGKESACNAGDPSLIPGSGRSAGEGIGHPLPYSWACLVAQLVKNPPAMWETWVQYLDWEDPLEKGKAYPLWYSGLENSMDYPWNHKESGTTEQLSPTHKRPLRLCGRPTCLERWIPPSSPHATKRFTMSTILYQQFCL